MAQPLCRHFGPCGGCEWQHLAYPEQLARKRQIVVDLLRASLGQRAPHVAPVIGMQPDQTGWPWKFRHKASFVFGEERGRLTIGHYAERSNTVVSIVECPVHADRANRLAFALHAELARAGISAAGPDLRGIARHLLIRTTRDDREAVAMLVVTRNQNLLRGPVRKFLASEERPSGFFLNIHDRPGPYMVGRETIKLDGHAHVRERIADVTFLVSPTAFFQTNATVASTLVDHVLAITEATEAAETTEMTETTKITERPSLRIADLYSGSGLFALPLAAHGHRVIAVEENEQAARDGEANVRLNRLPAERLRFIRSRVEDALPRLSKMRLDLAVIDPPRAGCPQAVIEALFSALRPQRVVYVSCNPEALARELPQILDLRYHVRHVQPVDMFPHTTHIETVVSLERATGA